MANCKHLVVSNGAFELALERNSQGVVLDIQSAVVCCCSVQNVACDRFCLLLLFHRDSSVLLFHMGAHHFDSSDDKLVPSSKEMVVEIVDRCWGGAYLETQMA